MRFEQLKNSYTYPLYQPFPQHSPSQVEVSKPFGHQSWFLQVEEVSIKQYYFLMEAFENSYVQR